ncbi:MAG: hypothetical protein FJ320_05190 [SAR202 cluster bacterium]|nr:hypothetical protein [SAR202 cluster bacterium]
MEVTLALLADAANISQQGKLNILGAFNQIFAQTFPATHPELQLVVRFEADASEKGLEKTVKIVLLDPNGKFVREEGISLKLPPVWESGQKFGAILVKSIKRMEFDHPGTYELTILVDDDQKKKIQFQVVKQGA